MTLVNLMVLLIIYNCITAVPCNFNCRVSISKRRRSQTKEVIIIKRFLLTKSKILHGAQLGTIMALANGSISEDMDIQVQNLTNGLPDEVSRELCQALWTFAKEMTSIVDYASRELNSYLDQVIPNRRELRAQLTLAMEQGRQHVIRNPTLVEEVRTLRNLLRQDRDQEAPRLNPSPAVERVEPAVAVVEKIRDYTFPKKEGLQIVISRDPCILYRFTYASTKVVCADCNAQMKLITFKRFHKLTKNCSGQMRAEITNEANLARLEEDPDFNVDHLRV